jgi:hypothetical protein
MCFSPSFIPAAHTGCLGKGPIDNVPGENKPYNWTFSPSFVSGVVKKLVLFGKLQELY